MKFLCGRVPWANGNPMALALIANVWRISHGVQHSMQDPRPDLSLRVRVVGGLVFVAINGNQKLHTSGEDVSGGTGILR